VQAPARERAGGRLRTRESSCVDPFESASLLSGIYGAAAYNRFRDAQFLCADDPSVERWADSVRRVSTYQLTPDGK